MDTQYLLSGNFPKGSFGPLEVKLLADLPTEPFMDPVTTVIRTPDASKPLERPFGDLYDVLAPFWAPIGARTPAEQVAHTKTLRGTLTITRNDGVTAPRTWTLEDAFPIEINFGYLDYSSSTDSDIEITWRHSQGSVS